jgi:hypothetical protein
VNPEELIMTKPFNPDTVRAFMLLSAAMFTGGAIAAPTFLPAVPGDLVPQQILAPDASLKSAGAPDLPREAVTMSWAVQGEIAAVPQPFVGQSREYYKEVSANELAAGVTIHTTAPRALIRLQPLAGQGAVAPQALVLTSPAGRAFAAGSGMDMLASADKLAGPGVPFAQGTSAFRIHPDLGAGAFRLQAADAAGGRYLINVVEPDSPYALTMQTDAPSYLHGQQLTVSPELVEQAGARVMQRHAIGKLDGVVISPAGRSFPVAFKVDKDGRLRARLPLDANEAPSPGLWEVRASGQAFVHGQIVQRSLRVAFAVAMPVARLSKTAAVVNEPGSIGLRLGVDVAAAGRYEARALLYGMVDGQMKPLAVAHSAQWLEAGAQSLVVRYSAELLAGASGPFEIRDLNLIDQGRMAVLQRQQRAVSLDERDLARTGAQAMVARPAQKEKKPAQNF